MRRAGRVVALAGVVVALLWAASPAEARMPRAAIAEMRDAAWDVVLSVPWDYHQASVHFTQRQCGYGGRERRHRIWWCGFRVGYWDGPHGRQGRCRVLVQLTVRRWWLNSSNCPWLR